MAGVPQERQRLPLFTIFAKVRLWAWYSYILLIYSLFPCFGRRSSLRFRAYHVLSTISNDPRICLLAAAATQSLVSGIHLRITSRLETGYVALARPSAKQRTHERISAKDRNESGAQIALEPETNEMFRSIQAIQAVYPGRCLFPSFPLQHPTSFCNVSPGLMVHSFLLN